MNENGPWVPGVGERGRCGVRRFLIPNAKELCAFFLRQFFDGRVDNLVAWHGVRVGRQDQLAVGASLVAVVERKL